MQEPTTTEAANVTAAELIALGRRLAVIGEAVEAWERGEHNADDAEPMEFADAIDAALDHIEHVAIHVPALDVEPGGIAESVRRVQAMRDEAAAYFEEYDVPGGWLDAAGSWKDWESEAEGSAAEARVQTFDQALDVMHALAHGLTPAQGATTPATSRALYSLSLARTALSDPGAVLDTDLAPFEEEARDLDAIYAPSPFVLLAIDAIDQAMNLLGANDDARPEEATSDGS